MFESHTPAVPIGMALFSLIRSTVRNAIDTMRNARAINLERSIREPLAIVTHRCSVGADRTY